MSSEWWGQAQSKTPVFLVTAPPNSPTFSLSMPTLLGGPLRSCSQRSCSLLPSPVLTQELSCSLQPTRTCWEVPRIPHLSKDRPVVLLQRRGLAALSETPSYFLLGFLPKPFLETGPTQPPAQGTNISTIHRGNSATFLGQAPSFLLMTLKV